MLLPTEDASVAMASLITVPEPLASLPFTLSPRLLLLNPQLTFLLKRHFLQQPSLTVVLAQCGGSKGAANLLMVLLLKDHLFSLLLKLSWSSDHFDQQNLGRGWRWVFKETAAPPLPPRDPELP